MRKNLVTPFRVELEDGTTFVGRYLPVDVVAAERHFNGLAGHDLEGGLYAIWHNLRARGDLTDMTFAGFIDVLVDYLRDDDAVETAQELEGNPNAAAAAPGEAPSSQGTQAAPGSATTSPPSASEPASLQAS